MFIGTFFIYAWKKNSSLIDTVCRHDLKDDTPVSEDKQAPILGHVSMVTDMVI